MIALRLYPGPDGESHFENVGLDVLSQWAKPGTTMAFLSPPPGFVDFHASDRPHMAVVLAGKMEVSASDGTKHVVGPGGCVLAEDIRGKGHATRILEGEPFKVAMVNLARS